MPQQDDFDRGVKNRRAVLGALVGAAIGFFAGEEAANEAFDAVTSTVNILRDTPRLIESSVLLFGTPEDKRRFYEERELEIGLVGANFLNGR